MRVELLGETVVGDQRHSHAESLSNLFWVPVHDHEQLDTSLTESGMGAVKANDGSVGAGPVVADKGQDDRNAAAKC